MIAVLSPSNPAGKEVAWGLMAAAAMYFAPTLLAAARRRGAAPLTFSFNLFLGWTGVGWVLAWLLALADRRLHIHVTTTAQMPALVPPMQSPSIAVAPDGRHWWDGGVWRDGWEFAPIGTLRSPDGEHWFSGTQWVALHPARRLPGQTGGPIPTRQPQEKPRWWEDF